MLIDPFGAQVHGARTEALAGKPSGEDSVVQALEEENPEGQDGLRLLILRAVLKQMFGVELEGRASPGTGQAAANEVEGVSLSGRMRLSMQQRFSFSLEAELRNEQGDTRRIRIEMNVSFSMDLELRWQQAAEAEMTDPLVIQLGDQPLELAKERYRFDLNLDGLTDALPGLGDAAAYLVLDSNGNGRIDDGRELFGPRLGNGFMELSALDENADGRIDARDAVYSRLQLWQPGRRLRSLAEAGIDALSLQRTAVDRSLFQQGKLMGLVREQSSLEGAVTGRLLEVDLRV